MQTIRGRLTAWYSAALDRKSTRLNSSHRCISYAVFCLKKKNLAYLGRGVGYRVPRLPDRGPYADAQDAEAQGGVAGVIARGGAYRAEGDVGCEPALLY